MNRTGTYLRRRRVLISELKNCCFVNNNSPTFKCPSLCGWSGSVPATLSLDQMQTAKDKKSAKLASAK